ncbi:M15 family metallopeptidase [Pseudomonas brassicacearum]|uniref:Peptidase M15C domain-containing protein n=1 Tax=Pseudomonas brassicacearum TaxID=930166 RepID=A0A423GIR6_9PSED|nr:M15 family metallopeptidase [Pseudomonas brassicacearum]ROM89583.1 hypothetical protein BK658_28015 [Pseudomonas brassicacearum]
MTTESPKFRLSKRSETMLDGVLPKLAEVVRLAIKLTEVDFGVTAGRRTPEEQHRLYGQGRTESECRVKGVNSEYAQPNKAKVTWTLDSKHVSGRAVDLVPYVGKELKWDNDGKLGLWPKIAEAMKSASDELKVSIIWGGDWKVTLDRPHFELVEVVKPDRYLVQ